MITPFVRIKRLHPAGQIPTYGSEGAAGFDLYASQKVSIQPNTWQHVPLGLAFEIPAEFEMQIRSRSGMTLKGLTVMNQPATIDSDYRGEVTVLIHNSGNVTRSIETGERFAQGVIAPVAHALFREVEELTPTERGSSGFGSTGS